MTKAMESVGKTVGATLEEVGKAAAAMAKVMADSVTEPFMPSEPPEMKTVLGRLDQRQKRRGLKVTARRNYAQWRTEILLDGQPVAFLDGLPVAEAKNPRVILEVFADQVATKQNIEVKAVMDALREVFKKELMVGNPNAVALQRWRQRRA
jgi:hypothetical protein